MGVKWFYRVMGEEFGPVSAIELKEAANRGELLYDSQVRKDVDGEWISVDKVKNLFDGKRPRPPKLPEPPPQSMPIASEVIAATPSPPPRRPQPPTAKQKHWLYGWRFRIVASIAALVMLSSWSRNNDLRSKLHGCNTYGVIQADVYYDGWLSSDVVVFDLDMAESIHGSGRRIDAVHLLMQFAGKTNLRSVKKVVLARDGLRIFYVEANDLEALAKSYSDGYPIAAFNNLPSKVRNMSGTQEYGEWTGGWLGVMSKQAQDLGKLLGRWLGYSPSLERLNEVLKENS